LITVSYFSAASETGMPVKSMSKHVLMKRITDDYIEYFKWLETEGLLLPTVSYEPCNRGTFCFTREFPGNRTWILRRQLEYHRICMKNSFFHTTRKISILPWYNEEAWLQHIIKTLKAEK